MSKKDFMSNDGGGWAELRVEPRELVVPHTRDDSEDDIPTLPDLDELQEALEKEAETVTAPVVPEQWVRPDSGTYAELEAEEAHVGDVSLTTLLAHVRAVAGPNVALEPDTVWTIASLLNDLNPA